MLIHAQGIKAAHEAHLSKSGHAKNKRSGSTSLNPIQEGEVTLEDAGQLPTPRETPQPEPNDETPMVSETLFTQMDVPLDSEDSNTNRTRMATSGNPLFTVVERSGIFDMEVIFCVCSDGENTEEQLLQARLFPATFRQIETLFTVSVLEDFLTDNLECKTTAQQYYSKLQSITSKMFPYIVPVCFSHLSYTYLIKINRTATSSS